MYFNDKIIDSSYDIFNIDIYSQSYDSLLKVALSLKFFDLHPFNPVYIAGVDLLGRRIVVLNAHALNDYVSKETFLLYFLRKIHRIVLFFLKSTLIKHVMFFFVFYFIDIIR